MEYYYCIGTRMYESKNVLILLLQNDFSSALYSPASVATTTIILCVPIYYYLRVQTNNRFQKDTFSLSLLSRLSGVGQQDTILYHYYYYLLVYMTTLYTNIRTVTVRIPGVYTARLMRTKTIFYNYLTAVNVSDVITSAVRFFDFRPF